MLRRELYYLNAPRDKEGKNKTHLDFGFRCFIVLLFHFLSIPPFVGELFRENERQHGCKLNLSGETVL